MARSEFTCGAKLPADGSRPGLIRNISLACPATTAREGWIRLAAASPPGEGYPELLPEGDEPRFPATGPGVSLALKAVPQKLEG